MEKKNKSVFLWPNRSDIIWVSVKDHLWIVVKLQSYATTGRMYKLPEARKASPLHVFGMYMAKCLTTACLTVECLLCIIRQGHYPVTVRIFA